MKLEWLQFYEKQPSGYFRFIQSWDTACKDGNNNSWSVCTTWMVHEGKYYLIDVFRARLTYPDLRRKAIELFNKFQPSKVYIEDRASGMQLI